MNIAIDGPAGAGKSTIAKLLAQRLGIVYLDTGAMYRAVALKTHRAGVRPDDEPAVAALLEDTDIDFSPTGRVLLDGEDVSEAIRQHFVSKLASDVSALPVVRLRMVDLQRHIAAKADTVLDGRDIGTFVLPDAAYKFFLTASPEVRARRRCDELTQRGVACDYETVKRDIIERDYNDSHRALAPLKRAEDAIEVDTSALTIDEVTDTLLRYIGGRA